ncbi:MAG: hypothetical protein ACE5IZ_00795 [Dehalococcoidia bacterium]
MVRWAAALALVAILAVTLLNFYSRATAPTSSALATSGCEADSPECQGPYAEAWLADDPSYYSEATPSGPGYFAGQFQVIDYTIFVGGCYTLDLHQVTYLGPDGSSTYVARWCG